MDVLCRRYVCRVGVRYLAGAAGVTLVGKDGIGGVRVNSKLEAAPDVYCAGDCACVPFEATGDPTRRVRAGAAAVATGCMLGGGGGSWRARVTLWVTRAGGAHRALGRRH